ncbi:ankyrin repeat-containing domain protein [Geopyxis carbonaria]|nr:ankyrin repeat-containing domain protein [Geopyxis carbonaria]
MSSPAPRTLLSLPNEILLQIGESLAPLPLTCLIRVNQHFHRLLTPTLYSAGYFSARSVLAWACTHGKQFLAQRMLREYAAAVTVTSPLDASNKMALHLAAQHGHTGLVTVLLALGAPIDDFYTMAESKTGAVHNALQLASKHGHTELVRVLLDSGAQIEARGHRGRSALCFAAAAGEIETVRLLIKRGATLYPRDAYDSGIGVVEFEKRMRKWQLPFGELEDALSKMKKQEQKWNEEASSRIALGWVIQ